jgi:hypothetical protein
MAVVPIDILFSIIHHWSVSDEPQVDIKTMAKSESNSDDQPVISKIVPGRIPSIVPDFLPYRVLLVYYLDFPAREMLFEAFATSAS